jgi:hypothetical protein
MKNETINGQEDISFSRPKKNKFQIGCLLTMVILSTLIIIGREIFILIDINYAKGNPTNLPASFSWSLRDHDYRTVKALSDPKLWPEMGTWMDEHEQV